MRVLVACEFSGIVRDAFIRRGHDAWSCDLLPTESDGPHIQTDVLTILEDNWDLMLAFPPCTYLTKANSLNYWKNTEKRLEALKFVAHLMNAPIDKICVENPVGAISKRIMKYSQIIQPWEYGHPAQKTTCLWLFGLPLLQPTDILPVEVRKNNLYPNGRDKLSVTPDRWKIRSRAYTGIAAAMANQWG